MQVSLARIRIKPLRSHLTPFKSYLRLLDHDIVVLLPIPTVLKLKLPRRQQIVVVMLFAAGLVVCVAGCARTYYTYAVSLTYDQTWAGWSVWLTGAIELYVAVVCRPNTFPLLPQPLTPPAALCQHPGSQTSLLQVSPQSPWHHCTQRLPWQISRQQHNRHNHGHNNGRKEPPQFSLRGRFIPFRDCTLVVLAKLPAYTILPKFPTHAILAMLPT